MFWFPNIPTPAFEALTGMGGPVATYGFLSVHSGSAAVAINTDGTPLTALNTAGPSNNVTVNAVTNKFTILTAGTYWVWCTLSASASMAQSVVHHHIQVNSADSELAFDRKFAAGDIGDGIAAGLITLNTGQELTVELTPTVNTDYTVSEGQFGCMLIG